MKLLCALNSFCAFVLKNHQSFLIFLFFLSSVVKNHFAYAMLSMQK